jgi:hypothetical protein
MAHVYNGWSSKGIGSGNCNKAAAFHGMERSNRLAAAQGLDAALPPKVTRMRGSNSVNTTSAVGVSLRTNKAIQLCLRAQTAGCT